MSTNNQLLDVAVKCRANDKCLFEGKDMFIDITLTNNQQHDIGFPLEYVQEKGPIIKLIDTRTGTDNFLPTNPANEALLGKLTTIAPRKSVVMEWVITAEELQQFRVGHVDLSAEFTIMAVIKMEDKKVDFRGSHRIRIVSREKK